MENRIRKILLPTDTTADILRHLSRKKLSRDLYLVNRNIWQIATSRHLVPNVHSIQEMFINTSDKQRRYNFYDIQEHVRDFDPKTNSGYGNLIRIGNNSEYYRFPVSHFIQKMSTQKPFVRFGKVWIKHCEDESLIEFLCNEKESFVGCDIKIDFHDSISNDAVNKLAYLSENAFIRAAKIALNELERSEALYIPFKFNYTQELHCALLNWLHDVGSERSTLVQRGSKQLVLGQYPREMILDMVEHVKQIFEDENLPPTAFLITFLGFQIGLYGSCLEGEHDFSLTITTGEKLSFFKTKMEDYRLWRRKVLKRITDWMTEWSYKYAYEL